MMNMIQHAVALPPNKVVMDCAARRKILRKVAPLAASAQDIHHPIHDRAHVCSPLAAAALRRWNERFNKRPLVIRQVAWVSQVIAIIFRSVLFRPHRRSLLESGHPQGITNDSRDSRSFETDTQADALAPNVKASSPKPDDAQQGTAAQIAGGVPARRGIG